MIDSLTQSLTGMSMLYRQPLDQARGQLEEVVQRHGAAADRALKLCSRLYRTRKHTGHDLVAEVETYINSMAAIPKVFAKAFSQYKLDVATFDGVVARINQDVKDATVKSSAGAGAGVAAGTATALLGPSAAMAIATTFGTASTGTAISTLSGAAATKAALAWLGGGALAAGGGGMSAGTALLGLAGPVGLALAGTAVVGGAAYMRYANRKATNEADTKRLAVEAEIRSMDATAKAVEQLSELTMTHVTGLHRLLTRLRDQDGLCDFNDATGEQQNMLIAMVNHVGTLGKLLNKTIDLKAAE